MTVSWRAAVLASAALAALASRTGSAAEPPGISRGDPEGERRVDFSADEVELDGRLEELELRGAVDVRVDRYRVTSERLRLRRTSKGIVVDGDGRVAFCPCPEPPVTFGFTSATAAPPSDLLLEEPTVRVGGVPVLWLPYLWLRSPDRPGALPPRVEWRGGDGLLTGGGVHVPIGAGPRRTDVDLEAAAYWEGGFELVGRAAGPGSTAVVRWDRLEGDLVGVDAVASSRPVSGSAVALRVDALRGPRARAGTLALEPASRAYDRAEIAAGHAAGDLVAGVGARSVAARGGDLSAAGAAGPVSHLGWGAPLGEAGAAVLDLTARTFGVDGDALTVVEQRAELEGTAHAGPVLARLRGGGRGVAAATRTDDGGTVAAAVSTTASVPLGRRHGSWLHVVTPRIAGGVGGAATAGTVPAAVPAPALPAARGVLVAGVASDVGSYSARQALLVDLHGGMVGLDRTPDLGGGGRARAHLAVAGGDVLAAALGDGSGVVVASTRWGPEDSVHLRAHAEGRRGVADRARVVADPDPLAARDPLLDRDGWSAGGEARVPWAAILASAAGAEWDVTSRRLLAVTAATGYRHRCGCLSVLAWAGHRVGREGFDARLTLDLLP